MKNSSKIRDALDSAYLDRKNVMNNAGFDAASKAWDFVHHQPTDHVSIWAMAKEAEKRDPVVWGVFRALVEAWLLEETEGTFSRPADP